MYHNFIQLTFNENDYTSVTPSSVFIAKHIYNEVNMLLLKSKRIQPVVLNSTDDLLNSTDDCSHEIKLSHYLAWVQQDPQFLDGRTPEFL